MQDKILANVAGRQIKESDLQVMINRYPAERRGYFATEDAKKQLLEQIIAFELLNKLGRELQVDSTEEYKENVRQAEHDILTQLTLNKVLLDVTITEEDALNHYNENKDQFTQAATVSAKHILVDSEDLAKNIKAEIESNSITFEDAAAKYSSCPSNAQGGNLGSFGRGMMVKEFEDVAFASNLNDVSDPVKTQFGYHLIKVEEKNEAKEMKFEEVKEQIINNLLQQMQEKKYVDTVLELEKKYGVTRA